MAQKKRYKIDELIDSHNLKEITSSYQPKEDDYTTDENEIPFVKISDMNQGKINYKSCRYLSKEKASFLLKSRVLPGDVIISKTGTLGKAAIVDSEHKFIIISKNIVAYRPLKRINSRYLMYSLNSPRIYEKLYRMNKYTCIQAVSQNELRSLEIYLPELKNQEIIGDLLYNLNERHEINNELNTNISKLLSVMFGKIKDEEDKSNICFLGNICRIRNKRASAYGKNIDSECIESITDGVVKYSQPNDNKIKTNYTSKEVMMFEAYDILLSVKHSKIDLLIPDFEGICSNMIVLIPMDKRYIPYIYCVIQYLLNKRSPYKNKSISNDNIWDYLKNTKITIPSLYNINQFYDESFIFIDKLNQNLIMNAALERLKSTLMNKITTGIPIKSDMHEAAQNNQEILI